MAVDQLPGRVREFASYLDALLARLDPRGGWNGVFWERDPEGMRACLAGREVPPWDVVEALLEDLGALYGPATAGAERERARALHAAAVTAYDARPGARDALADRLDVMLREQRYAAERHAGLSRRLSAPVPGDQPDALRLDLAWARDDHARATARCAELRARLEALDRRPDPGQAQPGEPGEPVDPARLGRPARLGESGRPGQLGALGQFAQSGQLGEPARPAGPGQLAPPGEPGEPVDPARPGTSGQLAWFGQPGQPGRLGESGEPAQLVRPGHLGPSGQSAQPGRLGHPGRSALSGRLGHPGQSSQSDDPPQLGKPAPPGQPGPPGQFPEPRQPAQPSRSAQTDPVPGVAPVSDVAVDPARAVPSAAPRVRTAVEPEEATHGVVLPVQDSRAAGAGVEAPGPSSPPPITRKPRKRRRGSARFAGVVDGEEAAPVVVPQASGGVGADGGPRTQRAPRGARFAGVPEAAEPVVPEGAPPLDEQAREAVDGVVTRLARLRAEGRSGEAHVVLVEAARWSVDRLPLLADALHRAGLGADWATLLWEAAALPAERLVAAADALAAAGRDGDGRQLLRQGVARPAERIGAAVLRLAEEGRTREVRALLDAYVRVRTPEEAARCVHADPGRLVPLLLEAALGVSDERHWDLVHALRVAGYGA
ncbi:hypothetical protein [Streptomyces sp. NPDC004658]|uniref:hypothetical protein n=1 Tax=Streptomyces sp. NPDC004658 TaxID=3154672 RepID=UPI0033A8707A